MDAGAFRKDFHQTQQHSFVLSQMGAARYRDFWRHEYLAFIASKWLKLSAPLLWPPDAPRESRAR